MQGKPCKWSHSVHKKCHLRTDTKFIVQQTYVSWCIDVSTPSGKNSAKLRVTISSRSVEWSISILWGVYWKVVSKSTHYVIFNVYVSSMVDQKLHHISSRTVSMKYSSTFLNMDENEHFSIANSMAYSSKRRHTSSWMLISALWIRRSRQSSKELAIWSAVRPS